MNVWVYLRLAAEAAKRDIDDPRCHAVGACAIRNDGVIVRSRNGHAKQKFPEAHAERRVLRKSTDGAIVFVARVRKGGFLGLAKPCPRCENYMRSTGVDKVYYTISDNEYGCITF